MSGTLELAQFTGDGSPLLMELRKIANAYREDAERRRKANQEAKAIEQQERDRLRRRRQSLKEASAVIDSADQAQARYNKGRKALNESLKAGDISQRQYNTGLRQLTSQLVEARREQSGENKAVADSRRILASTTTAQERYNQKLDSLNLSLKKNRISQREHAKGLRAIRGELATANLKQTDWNRSMGVSVGRMAKVGAGVGVVFKVIQQLRLEYENLIDRQRQAASPQLSLAKIQSQAVRNLGVDKEFDAKKLFAVIRGQSQTLGVKEETLTAAISDALSARGDGTARSAIKSVLAAARLDRFGDKESIRTLAGSATDIRKQTGLTDEAALGFLSQIGQLSRVTRTEELSRNIAPAVVSVLSSGVSKEFAGSMAAALSQGIVDNTGRVSRTSLVSVITALEKFDPGENIEQTFRRLLVNQGDRQRFFAENPFEKKALFAVRQLFTQGTKVNQTFFGGLQTLRKDPQAQFDSIVQQTESLESFRIAKLDQVSKNAVEQLQFADIDGAISAVVRDNAKGLRKALGDTALWQKFMEVGVDAVMGGERKVGELGVIARDRSAAIRAGALKRGDGLTAKEKNQLAVLDSFLNTIRGFTMDPIRANAAGQLPDLNAPEAAVVPAIQKGKMVFLNRKQLAEKLKKDEKRVAIQEEIRQFGRVLPEGPKNQRKPAAGKAAPLIHVDPMLQLVKHAESRNSVLRQIHRVLDERLPQGQQAGNAGKAEKKTVAATVEGQRKSVNRMRNRRGGLPQRVGVK